MDCLDCRRSSLCHNETISDINMISNALKALYKGYFLEAVETLELLQIKMETRNKEKTGRE